MHQLSAAASRAVLAAAMTRLVVEYAGHSLFNADSLTFGMHLAHHLAPEMFNTEQWDVLLGNLQGA